MAPQKLEPLETAVLEMLLRPDHPVLSALHAQLAGLTVESREFTGVGFFTMFRVTATAAPAPVASLNLGYVSASIDGLKHGAGFVLFVKGGVLSMLEGFSYDEPWPGGIGAFTLEYIEPQLRTALAELDRHR